MKTTHIKSNLIALSALAASIILGGCSQSSTDQSASSDPASLDSYLLAEKPKGAIPVVEARSSAKPGQPIVVSGQVGGAHKPFGNSYATLVIGDESLQYCNEIPGDSCSSPWDACCEDRDKIKAGRATVQVLADDTPIAQSLKGVGGLSELDHIVVAGTVDPSSTPENLIINATGIYRDSQ